MNHNKMYYRIRHSNDTGNGLFKKMQHNHIQTFTDDHSRVILKEEHESTDYINANYVKVNNCNNNMIK